MHSSRVQLVDAPTQNLTPSIDRQRLVVEGCHDAPECLSTRSRAA